MTPRIAASEVGDREYLLSDHIEGFSEYQQGSLSHIKQVQLDLLRLHPGLRLLDVGFGRGEFLRRCAERGAMITGIDSSEAALEIGRATLRDWPEADLRRADCRQLPFDSNAFDCVYSGDVIEHQSLMDGVTMLREMHRVLRPGGLLLLHTSPNAIFTSFVYPLARPLLLWISGAEATQVLEEHLAVNRRVHVHEYDRLSLRKAARLAGLSNAEVWIGADILRSFQHRHTRQLSSSRLARAAARMGRFALVRFFLGNDLFLRAVKPDAASRP